MHVQCRSVLGEIAVARGDLAAAEAEFTAAIEHVKESKLPLLELIAARNFRAHVLEPSRRGAEADALIATACAKMNGRTAADFAALLEKVHP